MLLGLGIVLVFLIILAIVVGTGTNAVDGPFDWEDNYKD